MSELFKTFEDQLDHLHNDLGLVFKNNDSRGTCKRYLETHNYRNFIDNYDTYFLDGNQKFLQTINSDMIINLFNFDKDISFELLNPILAIESKFNTTLAYKMEEFYKDKFEAMKEGKILQLTDIELKEIFPYRKGKFDLKGQPFTKEIRWIIGLREKNINCQYSNNSNEPLHSLCLKWTFGESIRLFRCLTPELRTQIAELFPIKVYPNFENDLRLVMDLLRTLRNKICHREKIFDIKTRFDEQFIAIFVNKNKLSKLTGQNIKIGNVIEILMYLLPHRKFVLKDKIKAIQDKYLNNLPKEMLEIIKSYTKL